MTQTVAILLNTSWNIYNFRRNLIGRLNHEGYQVLGIAPRDEYSNRLESIGCRYLELPMQNKGTNPIAELGLMYRLYRLLKCEKPSVVLAYTIKPNVYGAIVCGLLGIPIINNVSGLGTVFLTTNWITWVSRWMYRFSFSYSTRVFFQNQSDCDQFVREKLIDPASCRLLPGSGIDLAHYAYSERKRSPAIRFLLSGRLLKDKGVLEFVDAARQLVQRGEAEFCLLGFVDIDNKTALAREEVEAWEHEGVVHYLGATDDVRVELARCDCFVLPSYREGMSKALLEAAAVGRPIITTDVPGCREIVHDGVSGFLVEPRSVSDLAAKMQKMLELTHEQRLEMGRQSRKIVEQGFSEDIVIKQYVDVIHDILTK